VKRNLNMNSKKYIIFFFLFFILLFITPALTQAGPPDPDCDPLNPACPIDGGISFLIAAGIGLGVKRIIKKEE
jgi:hypothetical protein